MATETTNGFSPEKKAEMQLCLLALKACFESVPAACNHTHGIRLLLPLRTILDNVTLYGEINHDRSLKKKALEEFPVFGLSGYENAYPSSLSGGMRQRAAFLRTSLCKADILLLDEPFGALDVITRNDMQDWLLNLRKNYNRTTGLVTHDIDEAMYLSDRIIVLSNKPSCVIEEIDLSLQQKSRDWLFSQSEMKKRIYTLLKGVNHA